MENTTTTETTPTKRSFWLPTRPYSLIDAVNRSAAATGSVGYAMAATGANYNGHLVGFTKTYYGYWVAYYTWAGIVRICRGTLIECMGAAKREYDRGALGASSIVTVETDEEAAAAIEIGFVPYSKEIEEAHRATWQDDRFECLGEAFNYQKHGSAPAVGFLVNSATAAEYKAKLDGFFAERRAARATRDAEDEAREVAIEARQAAEGAKLDGLPENFGETAARRPRTVTPPRGMSERRGSITGKQESYLRSLCREAFANLYATGLDEHHLNHLSMKEASAKIDALKSAKARGWKE